MICIMKMSVSVTKQFSYPIIHNKFHPLSHMLMYFGKIYCKQLAPLGAVWSGFIVFALIPVVKVFELIQKVSYK